MAYFENPHKVFNIVYKQMPRFRELYAPIIDDLPIVNWIGDGLLKVSYLFYAT